MGLDYYFYLQVLESNAWRHHPQSLDSRNVFVSEPLMWFDDKDVTLHRLFLDEDAFFPLKRNRPPGLDIPSYFNRQLHSANDSHGFQLHADRLFQEGFVGWIGLDELKCAEWAATELYVSKPVPSHLAPLFADGTASFPAEAIREHPWTAVNPEQLQNVSTYAPDIRFVADGYGLHRQPIASGEDVQELPTVCWKTTLAEAIGPDKLEAIQNARMLAEDHRLRLTCFRS